MSDNFFDFVCADSETDGLKPSVIHMVGVQNLVTGEYREFVGPDAVGEACWRLANESRMIVGHHFLGYDQKVIADLAGIEIPKSLIVDTVPLSRRLCPYLPNHKLETWGEICGLPKLKSPIFERYTPYMSVYGERDVRLNTRVFGILLDIILEKYPDQLPREYHLIDTYLAYQTKPVALMAAG